MVGVISKKKRGRPKTKEGKAVTFYLSHHIIAKLRIMTTMTKNASKFIEDLIEEKHDATKEREGLDQS